MKARLAAPIIVALVLSVPAAMAATLPVGGGHYKGKTDSKTFFPTDQTVTIVVSRDRANFTSGRLNFVLLGQAGRGSCVGPAFITLGPTAARAITRQGSVNSRRHFPYSVTSSDPEAFRGTAFAILRASFSNQGRRVTGTLQMTVTSPGGGLTCHSGLVHFAASLI